MARSLITAKKWYRNMMAGNPPLSAYELIGTSLVGSGGTSSVVFSSIPSDYKHLQVRFIQKPVSAGYGGSIYLTPNDGVDYVGYNHRLVGNGSSVSSGSNGNPSLMYAQNIQSNGTSGAFNPGIIDILDYTSTSKHKTFKWMFGYHDSQGSRILLGSSGWNSFRAVTKLSFSVDGDLAQYSRVSLYGIRG
jgi:hypothetical protein